MTAQEQIDFVLKVCRLYDGTQKSEDENPYDQSKDELKWWMWKVEFKMVRKFPNNNLKTITEVAIFCAEYVTTGVEKMAGIPYDWDAFEARVKELNERYLSFTR